MGVTDSPGVGSPNIDMKAGMPSQFMGMGAMQQQPMEMTQTANKSADKGRPISSNAVAGTPWCVVWTGDGVRLVLKFYMSFRKCFSLIPALEHRFGSVLPSCTTVQMLICWCQSLQMFQVSA